MYQQPNARYFRILVIVCLIAFAACGSIAQTLDTFAPSPSSAVYAIAVQPDGKILIGGDFASVSGKTHPGLARLNPDGTVDDTFNPSTSTTAFSIVVQDDGRIVVGGWFTTLSGVARNYIGRFNNDGSLDTSFDLGLAAATSVPGVYSLTLQPDNSILLCGGFKKTGLATNVARLRPDLTFDTGLTAQPNDIVYTSATQADGKIVLGGTFTSVNGVAHSKIARLNADGSVDTQFTASASDIPLAMAIQSDGKIVLGGPFTTINGQPHSYIARLNNDGSLDTNFTASASGYIRSLALQADGKIIVGGEFSLLNGTPRSRLGRLNADGTLDTNFNITVGTFVYAVQMQSDSKILIGGVFSTVTNQSRLRIARINNTAAPLESMSFDGTNITWLRDGTAPEVYHTQFDVSTNGSAWVPLGSGARIPGGWQSTNVSFADAPTIRARGYMTGGRYVGSSSCTEFSTGPLAIGRQPASQTNLYGASVLFSVEAGGDAPLSYQWYKNGSAVTNGNGQLSALLPTFGLTNVSGADQGSYYVVITNASNVITSSVATLTVIDPAITAQPVSISTNAGQTAILQESTRGTFALRYQWFLNGVAVPGATSGWLTVTNVVAANAGTYCLVVTNIYGSATSSNAVLTVTDPYISSSPTNQLVNYGQSVLFQVAAAGTQPMSYQWRKNGANIATQTTSSLSITAAQLSDAGTYTVVVSNSAGTTNATNFVLQVNMVPTDPAFDPNPITDGILGREVMSAAIQNDGKILVGGYFTNLSGQYHNGIGRLNPDGTADSTFTTSAMDFRVYTFGVQPDGHIIVGGDFIALNGVRHDSIARLNPDSSLDTNFNTFTDAEVFNLLLPADGSIILNGSFFQVDVPEGATNEIDFRTNIARIFSDGSVDPVFDAHANLHVTGAALDQDGKLLVGGQFTAIGQPFVARTNIARLNLDGSVDPSFNATADNYVSCFAIQPNGSIIIGGQFNYVNGEPHTNLARLDATGVVDSSFTPSLSDIPASIALQADGRLIVAGAFKTANGVTRNGLARFNPDGSLDSSFVPTLIDPSLPIVHALAIQRDGEIIIGGQFRTVSGTARAGLARLLNVGQCTDQLMLQSNNIFWARSGVVPEITRATFEISANKTNWSSLPIPARVRNGWQLASNSALPIGSTIRARGFTASGGSSWFIETTLQLTAPTLLAANFISSSSQLTFTVAGTAGQTCVVEVSPDLISWTPIQTNSIPFDVVGSAISPTTQFYRARLP